MDETNEKKRKPCKECPFSPKTTPGMLGGSEPTVYIGQGHGPFFLPCHMDPKYEQDRRSHSLLQCAGAAIFRANVGVADMLPAPLLKLPADPELAFKDSAALLQHHTGLQEREARRLLELMPPRAWLRLELSKQGCTFTPAKKDG